MYVQLTPPLYAGITQRQMACSQSCFPQPGRVARAL